MKQDKPESVAVNQPSPGDKLFHVQCSRVEGHAFYMYSWSRPNQCIYCGSGATATEKEG